MLPPEAAPARLCHLVPCAAGRGQAALLRRCIWRRGGIRGSGETQQPRHCRRSNDSSPLTGLLPASAPAASAQRGHWVYAGCCSRAQLSFSISVTTNLFHLAAERSAEELLEQLPHRGQPRADGTLLLCCTTAIRGCWASPAMGEADLAAAPSQNTAAAPSPCESMLLARTHVIAPFRLESWRQLISHVNKPPSRISSFWGDTEVRCQVPWALQELACP